MNAIAIILITVFIGLYVFNSIKNTLVIFTDILNSGKLQPIFVLLVDQKNKLKAEYNKEFFYSPYYMVRDAYLYSKKSIIAWLNKS